MYLRRKTVTDKESERVTIGNNGKEIRKGKGMKESWHIEKLKYREKGKYIMLMMMGKERVRKSKID